MSRKTFRRDSQVGVVTRAALPDGVRRVIRRAYERATARPRIGRVQFGDLRRLAPFEPAGGSTCIDDALSRAFIRRHGGDALGGPGVLEVEGSPEAVDVADQYDRIICEGRLQREMDPAGSVARLHRALAHGGVLLVTVPGIAPAEEPASALGDDLWRFTTLSLRRMLEACFPAEDVTVEALGNVLAANGLLYGLTVDDLPASALQVHDPNYQVVIGARAVKR
jgi:hypothetical protein